MNTIKVIFNKLQLYFFIFCILFLITPACNTKDEVIYFQNQNKHLDLGFFHIDSFSSFNDSVNSNLYNFSIQTVPSFEVNLNSYVYKGIFWYAKNKIFAKFKSTESNVFVLFDFQLNINSIDTIFWRLKSKETNNKYEKKYLLSLEDKFYDENYKDSIYIFRYINYRMVIDDDDLVFFVGKNEGVVGVYHGTIEYENCKPVGRIFMHFGNIYLNTIDYSMVNFNYSIM